MKQLKRRLNHILHTEEWPVVLPAFGEFVSNVETDEGLRAELEKLRCYIDEKHKSHVSFDTIAERSQVVLTSMLSIYSKMLSEIEPIPSPAHMNNLIDAIRAAELLLSTLQNCRHVYGIFNRWYFLFCPSYYPQSCKVEPSNHEAALKQFLKIFGLMVCVVIPPDDELHANFCGIYSWFVKQASSSFVLSKAALRVGPDPSTGISSIFGINRGWFVEAATEPVTMHESCGMTVPLDFYTHMVQYSQDFRKDGGSFVTCFEERLLGVYEVFLSATISHLKQQLEECQAMKATFLSEVQTGLFAAVQLAFHSVFHCFSFL